MFAPDRIDAPRRDPPDDNAEREFHAALAAFVAVIARRLVGLRLAEAAAVLRAAANVLREGTEP